MHKDLQLDNVRGIGARRHTCRGLRRDTVTPERSGSLSETERFRRLSCIFDASVGTLAEDADVSPMHRNEVCNGAEREPVGPIPLNFWSSLSTDQSCFSFFNE